MEDAAVAFSDGLYVCESALDDLFHSLDSYEQVIPLDAIDAKVRSLSLEKAEYSKYIRFTPDSYHRALVSRTSLFEILILSWKSGQISPIHNHRGSSCVVKVLQGTATEINYRWSGAGKLYPAATADAKQGSVLSSFDADIHQLGNLQGPEDPPLVTLHVYSPPAAMDLFPLAQSTFSNYDQLLLSSFKGSPSVHL